MFLQKKLLAVRHLKGFFIGALSLAFQSCSAPDLNDPEVLKTAFRKAIPISELSRERMHGIIMLFVDGKGEPFTGWVKEEWNKHTAKTLGFIKKGQREGLWLTWHPNGSKATETYWQMDLMDGSFQTWYENGKTEIIGQTKDGEVDGEWKRYYANGQLLETSLNRVGRLVRIKVWRYDGQACVQSEVQKGYGAYILYDQNGTKVERRVFESGVQVNPDE